MTESIDCLRNQLAEKDAEIERLRLVEDELEKKFENTFIDLNLEIERLQKIIDDRGKRHADKIANKILGFEKERER